MKEFLKQYLQDFLWKLTMDAFLKHVLEIMRKTLKQFLNESLDDFLYPSGLAPF